MSKTERVSRAHDNFGRSAAAMMVSRNFRKLSVNAYVSHPRPYCIIYGRTVVLWICKTRRLKTTDYNIPACCSGKRSHHALLSFFPRPLPSFPLLAVSVLQATGSWRAYCKRRKLASVLQATGSWARAWERQTR